MELLQEIAVESVGRTRCADSTATGIPPLGPSPVFFASQCVHRRSFDLIISHYLARSD